MLLASGYFLVFNEFLYLLYVPLLCNTASFAFSDPKGKDEKSLLLIQKQFSEYR